MNLKPDILISERYKLIRLLGRGGFSDVWLAEDTCIGLQLVIKIFAPNGGLDRNAQKIFSEEYKSVFSLNHQNLLIPQHLDFYQDMPFLILPYCEKGSLVKKVGSITEKEAWKIIYDVAAGLDYLHKHDIVHQDIKPDNILVTADERYMITDFGISVRLQSTLRKSVNKAAEAGTVSYMAPERFSAHPKPIFASDVWSLGAMMYELIEGDVPYGNMGGVLQKSGAEIPEIEANVSDELKNIIRQMMSLEPWDRPTADKLVEIARNAIERKTEPIAAGRPTKPKATDRGLSNKAQEQKKDDSKKKKGLIGIISFVVLMIIGSTFFLMRGCKADDKEIIELTADNDSITSDDLLKDTVHVTAVESIEIEDYLQVSVSNISAKAEGKTETIKVSSNVDWNIDYPSGDMYSATRNGDKVKVVINPNTTTSKRTDYFNIKSSDGTLVRKISLSQAAGKSAVEEAAVVEAITETKSVSTSQSQSRTYLGPFSVSATKRVNFSKGNLQFNAAQGSHRCADGTTRQGTWRFAPNQWDCIGYGNKNISPTYDGWIDLFGWGTSGWNNTAKDSYAVNYQPWSSSTSTVNISYNDYGYGPSTNQGYGNLTGSNTYFDWGVYNQIGSDAPGTWRALTYDEWSYVYSGRANAKNLCGQATVNGVLGFVLLPDDFWSNSGNLAFTPGTGLSWNVNRFSVSQWREFEQRGAVFLPTGGYRDGSSVDDVGSYGGFWSVSQGSSGNAGTLYVNSGNSGMGYGKRYGGRSVRLSQDL